MLCPCLHMSVISIYEILDGSLTLIERFTAVSWFKRGYFSTFTLFFPQTCSDKSKNTFTLHPNLCNNYFYSRVLNTNIVAVPRAHYDEPLLKLVIINAQLYNSHFCIHPVLMLIYSDLFLFSSQSSWLSFSIKWQQNLEKKKVLALLQKVFFFPEWLFCHWITDLSEGKLHLLSGTPAVTPVSCVMLSKQASCNHGNLSHRSPQHDVNMLVKALRRMQYVF